VSQAPERIAALDELREGLREAARRDVAAAAPRRRRRRQRRAGGLLAAGVLVAAGAAGAAQLISTGRPVRDVRQGIVAGYRPAPGMSQLPLIARDPGGGAAWGVRVYSARNGDRCVVAGVVNGAALGEMSGGRFHPYPTDRLGSCNHPGHPFAALHRDRGRTLVFGIAHPGARRVSIAVGGGKPHAAPTGRGGAFLAVYRGEIQDNKLKIDYAR
jgi:hypothetical protein